MQETINTINANLERINNQFNNFKLISYEKSNSVETVILINDKIFKEIIEITFIGKIMHSFKGEITLTALEDLQPLLSRRFLRGESL